MCITKNHVMSKNKTKLKPSFCLYFYFLGESTVNNMVLSNFLLFIYKYTIVLVCVCVCL